MVVENKADDAAFDPVTVADRSAEQELRRLIAKAWPDHGVAGEEHPDTGADADYQWVLDPIDGTRSFIMGLPTWGTLIGLTHKGTPVVGMMAQPFTQERFWADDEAAYMVDATANPETRLKTRSCPTLSDAILTTTHPDMFATAHDRNMFDQVSSKVRMTRFGGDCYQYCMLAAGFVDIVIESDLQPYDVMALIPIVERAGGRITTWTGEPATTGGQIVAVGDAKRHDEVLRLLNE